MNHIEQSHRFQQSSDAFLKNNISMIQQICVDVDPDTIAMILHECDYNVQSAIFRIQAGNFQNGDWKRVEPNNKKKNNISREPVVNFHVSSDNERSISQRTSPTTSIENGQGQNDKQKCSSSTYMTDDSIQNHSETNNSIDKITSQEINGVPSIQCQTIETKRNKNTNKHRISSSIPEEPVVMHATVKYSKQFLDVQFGDIKWNGSILTEIDSFDNSVIETEKSIDVQNEASVNEIDKQINETTDQFPTSLSFLDNNNSNQSINVPIENTSHLSDQLNDNSSQSQHISIQNTVTNLPTTSQYVPMNNQQNHVNPNLQTTYTHNSSLNGTHWNNQATPYKASSKSTIIPSASFATTPSYQLPQQQFVISNNPYQSLSPTLVQFVPSFDHWGMNGYPGPYEPFTFGTTNYISTYPNQQHYQPTNGTSFDKEFFATYGQPTLPNNDFISTSSSHTINDNHQTSKQSSNAATFSHGMQNTTPVYLNPVAMPFGNYMPPVTNSTHHDRMSSRSSLDNRENRNGTVYNGINNRNQYYYHHGQQRLHNNNPMNSNWQ